MPNASPQDARAGWDIYLRAGGDISRDDLNSQLRSAGYSDISARTYEHYHRLLRGGFFKYIPINQFDVARSSDPYEVVATQGRYPYRAADVGIQALIAKASSLFEAFGRAIEVADVGAVLLFDDPDVAAGISSLKLTSGDMLSLRFLEAGRSVTARVSHSDMNRQIARVDVQYVDVMSIGDITPGSTLDTEDVHFALLSSTEDDSTTMDLAGRRIFHFFELLEGARSLINLVGARQQAPVYAAPPILTRLSIASPLNVVVDIATTAKDFVPIVALNVLMRASSATAKFRNDWLDASLKKEELSRQRAGRVTTMNWMRLRRGFSMQKLKRRRLKRVSPRLKQTPRCPCMSV